MTKKELINIFLKEADSKSRRYSEATKKDYLQYIEKYLDSLDKDLSDTTEREIRKFLANYEDKADTTYNLVLSALSSFYNIIKGSYMCPVGYVKENPCKNIKCVAHPIYKEKHAITTEDFKKLLDVCKNSRDKALIMVLGCTGMRIDEVLSLTYSQYINREDDGGIKLTITKGSKERIIYFNDEIEETLRDYVNNDRKNGDTLFVSNYGNKMNKSCVWRTIRCLGKRANLDDSVIDGLSAHTFRHYTTTRLLTKGVPLPVVSTILGHSNSTITMRYLDRSLVDVKSAMCM